MILASFRRWLAHKWIPLESTLCQSYQIAFSGEHGERVLQHLLDSVYCSVYEGSDPTQAVIHNARRSVIHEILLNIDLAESQPKSGVHVEMEGEDALVG